MGDILGENETELDEQLVLTLRNLNKQMYLIQGRLQEALKPVIELQKELARTIKKAEISEAIKQYSDQLMELQCKIEPAIERIRELQKNWSLIQTSIEIDPSILLPPEMLKLIEIEAKIDELYKDVQELKETKRIEREEYEKLKRKLKELEEELGKAYQ